MRTHFTAVCRSNLNLANAKFLYGVCGLNLDILARGPLWEMGIDYKCGTGHGVGYILNVHEGPNAFRYKGTEDRPGGAVFEEGMASYKGVKLARKTGLAEPLIKNMKKLYAKALLTYVGHATATGLAVGAASIIMDYFSRPKKIRIEEGFWY